MHTYISINGQEKMNTSAVVVAAASSYTGAVLVHIKCVQEREEMR